MSQPCHRLALGTFYLSVRSLVEGKQIRCFHRSSNAQPIFGCKSHRVKCFLTFLPLNASHCVQVYTTMQSAQLKRRQKLHMFPILPELCCRYASLFNSYVGLLSAAEDSRPLLLIGMAARGMGPLRAALEWTPIQAHATANPVVLFYVAQCQQSAALLAEPFHKPQLQGEAQGSSIRPES